MATLAVDGRSDGLVLGHAYSLISACRVGSIRLVGNIMCLPSRRGVGGIHFRSPQQQLSSGVSSLVTVAYIRIRIEVSKA